jgi:hypothetical protein
LYGFFAKNAQNQDLIDAYEKILPRSRYKMDSQKIEKNTELQTYLKSAQGD